MKNQKGIVAKVNLIVREIEGIMLPNGEFGITLQQLRELAFPTVLPKSAQKHLKSACGKDFEFVLSATELNNRPQVIIKLEQLSHVITMLAIKGHKEAIELSKELSYLSLHQLFCDAFGVEFEKREREEWIKFRQQARQQYHPYLTYWLGKDGTKNSYQYGFKVNQFKKAANLPIHNVNEYNTDELRLLTEAEIRYDLLRDLGKTHTQALDYINK